MPSGLTVEHIERLWERMAMIYGNKWTSGYGAADDGTWLTGLYDVTPEQIGAGLEKIRVSPEPWPPTLPQFRAICLAQRETYKPHPLLMLASNTREDRIKAADKHLAGILGRLKGAR